MQTSRSRVGSAGCGHRHSTVATAPMGWYAEFVALLQHSRYQAADEGPAVPREVAQSPCGTAASRKGRTGAAEVVSCMSAFLRAAGQRSLLQGGGQTAWGGGGIGEAGAR